MSFSRFSCNKVLRAQNKSQEIQIFIWEEGGWGGGVVASTEKTARNKVRSEGKSWAGHLSLWNVSKERSK